MDILFYKALGILSDKYKTKINKSIDINKINNIINLEKFLFDFNNLYLYIEKSHNEYKDFLLKGAISGYIKSPKDVLNFINNINKSKKDRRLDIYKTLIKSYQINDEDLFKEAFYKSYIKPYIKTINKKKVQVKGHYRKGEHLNIEPQDDLIAKEMQKNIVKLYLDMNKLKEEFESKNKNTKDVFDESIENIKEFYSNDNINEVFNDKYLNHIMSNEFRKDILNYARYALMKNIEINSIYDIDDLIYEYNKKSKDGDIKAKELVLNDETKDSIINNAFKILYGYHVLALTESGIFNDEDEYKNFIDNLTKKAEQHKMESNSLLDTIKQLQQKHSGLKDSSKKEEYNISELDSELEKKVNDYYVKRAEAEDIGKFNEELEKNLLLQKRDKEKFSNVMKKYWAKVAISKAKKMLVGLTESEKMAEKIKELGKSGDVDKDVEEVYLEYRKKRSSLANRRLTFWHAVNLDRLFLMYDIFANRNMTGYLSVNPYKQRIEAFNNNNTLNFNGKLREFNAGIDLIKKEKIIEDVNNTTVPEEIVEHFFTKDMLDDPASRAMVGALLKESGGLAEGARRYITNRPEIRKLLNE